MRVAILHPCYWPEVRRGTERVIRELADGLAARGHEPVLLTSHPEATSRGVEDGLRIVRARRPRDVRLRARGWDRYLAHAPRSLVELVRVRPDVAHALYPADAVAASATRRPVVFSYMGLPGWGLPGRAPWAALDHGTRVHAGRCGGGAQRGIGPSHSETCSAWRRA